MEISFAEKLKKLRSEKNITQRELAERINVPLSTVKSWETGRRLPGEDMIYALQVFFSVTSTYLLGNEDTEDNAENKVAIDENVIWACFLKNTEACLKDALRSACIDLAHFVGTDSEELWGRYVKDSAVMYSTQKAFICKQEEVSNAGE